MQEPKPLSQAPQKPTSGKEGRPTVLSPEVEQAILVGIKSGLSLAEAAERAGVDRASLFNWMRWGRAGHPDFAAFFQHIQQEKARGRAGAAGVAKRGLRGAF